ncbi:MULTISPECIES: hypothetical protein [Gordonia]|uniref:Uncharacterized protein n=1 Tax=Gordonia sihwensis NBRC 108236 TaxID=1223544 RepID=L7LNZ7_9ACTN|nr:MULTISPECIES: hypothetical protein [Gordonia]AUH68591.1 hypothetical protein CXX93_09765 [Gordonia sp. YC-JH1]GAC62441.1 hypothetical protein GSI01S_34_00530 [Gordonia sihwensis NBRC 108236]
MNEHDAGNDGPTGRPVPPTGEHHFAAAGYPPPTSPFATPPGTLAPPESAAAPKRPRKRGRILFAIVAAVFIAVGSGAVGYAIGSDESATSGTETAASPEYSYPPTTGVSTVPVTAADFSLSVLTEEKKCFGSAGCLVTISLEPTFKGASSVLTDRSFKVLYEIDGGEDPILDKFTMVGTQVTIDQSTSVETPSSDTEVTARVTQVVETTDEG